MLENVSYVQRYDIKVMLCLLPHVLFHAITAPEAAALPAEPQAGGGTGEGHTAADTTNSSASLADGPAARAAILAEITAVVRQCLSKPSSGDAGPAAAVPPTALHLQAILTATDGLHRWLYESQARLISWKRRLDAEAGKSNTSKSGSTASSKTRPPELKQLERNVQAVQALHAALLPPSAAPGGSAAPSTRAGAAAAKGDSAVDLTDEADAPDAAPAHDPESASAADVHLHETATMEELALASHACGAHARALRHYELWLRHTKGRLNNPPRKSFGVTFTDSEVCPVQSSVVEQRADAFARPSCTMHPSHS